MHFYIVGSSVIGSSRLLRLLVVVIHTSDHPKCKLVGLVFRIGPKHVMTHFMVKGVYPSPLGIVLSSVFPVFRMNQINLAVLISLAGGFTPVDILKPFHLGVLQVIKPAKKRYGSFKRLRFVFMKKR